MSWLGVAAAALAALFQSTASAPSTRPASRPSLVVVCVFDQTRGDYLDRFDKAFGDGGFRRVKREGVHFTNCHYPYADTETAPGHTTLATGRLPRHHSITSNEWWDDASQRVVYGFEDASVKLIGPSGPVAGAGVSPKNLAGETLSDVLRSQSRASRVYAISSKDRSAIPMGGRQSNGSYWFAAPAAGFVTSSFYAGALPEWMSSFTKKHNLDSYPRTWERALPEAAYAHLGLDARAFERPRAGMGTAFPHPLFTRPTAAEQWEAVTHSALWMPTLTDLALELLDREALGRGAEPDLLWISYSQTDLCGHYFGPDSHELFDAFARADRELERLLTALDAAVGKGRYVMALTSDHGVGEAPETLAAAGRDAGRVTLAADKDGRPVAFLAEIEDALSERLGKRPKRRWVRYASAVGMVLWDAELDAAGLDKAAANRALRDVLRAHPKIAAAYTQEEVERAGGDVNSPFLRQFHNSNVPSRCAGVQYVLKSGWLATTTPATHGTPHSHDTHVPLLLAGPGVRKGAVDAKAVSPLDLTPTLARILGIRAPAGCDGAVLPAFVP